MMNVFTSEISTRQGQQGPNATTLPLLQEPARDPPLAPDSP